MLGLFNMKTLCQVVFSTNRIPYITRTLESQKQYLDTSGVSIHKIFIDDYPLNRDNEFVTKLAKHYEFDEIILHEENMGITSTWDQFFQLIRERNYDYVLHHEDDVELFEPIKLIDMVDFLEENKNFYQIQLKRNNWYQYEVDDFKLKDTDIAYRNYYYEKQTSFFNMLFAVYPAWVAKENYKAETGSCPSENVIANLLVNKYNLTGAYLKSSTGGYLVKHIGETTRGKRMNEGEPGWELFGGNVFDPSKLYNSRYGNEVVSID
jgi:hypothetical protein